MFGVGATLLGRGIEVAAGFGIVWFLTGILAAEGYGRFLLAMTLIELTGLTTSGGLEAVVLYRCSRGETPPGQLDSGEVAGAALGWGLLIGAVATAGVWLAAPALGVVFDDPGAGDWIRRLAWLIPLQVGRAIYAAWHRARQRVPQSALLGQALPRVASMGALGLVFALAPTPGAIAAALLLGPLLVLVPWFLAAPLRPTRLCQALGAWDLQYALKLGLNRVLAQGITHADILVLGVLSTSLVTGRYGVASRIALTTSLAFAMLMPTFMSRIGYLRGRDRREDLAREYEQTRSVALLGALVMATALGFGGPFVLGLFGDFEAATPVLWILCAAWIGQASFGMNRSYLGLAGYAGWTLSTALLLLLSNLALCVILIPRWGGEGAALAALLSIVGVRALTSWVIWKLERFATWSLELAALTAAALALLLAGAAGALGPAGVGGGLSVVLALFLARRCREWAAQLGSVLQELRRPDEAR